MSRQRLSCPKSIWTIWYPRVIGPPTFKRILPFYQKWFDEYDHFAGGIPTHDPSAIACLLDRGLYRIERLPVHVETQGRGAGQTVSDPRRQWSGLPEIDICLDVNVPGVLKLYRERMTR